MTGEPDHACVPLSYDRSPVPAAFLGRGTGRRHGLVQASTRRSAVSSRPPALMDAHNELNRWVAIEDGFRRPKFTRAIEVKGLLGACLSGTTACGGKMLGDPVPLPQTTVPRPWTAHLIHLNSCTDCESLSACVLQGNPVQRLNRLWGSGC